MKNWFSHLVGACALLFVFSACEKDETKVILTPSDTPTLTASTGSVVLVQGRRTTPAVTYSWRPIGSFAWSSGVENPYSPAVTYSLQVDKQGNNFANPVTLDAGAGPNTVVTYGQLNAALTSLGIAPGVATPIETRLRTGYAPNAPLYTPAIALTATGYECIAPTTDTWSIIGPAGVDWNTDIQMTYDCDLQAYTLTRNLKAGEFKFRKNRDWGVNYGSGTARDANGAAPVVTNGPNITVPATGTYTVSLNVTTLTYALSQ
ncbi:MAG: SusE domain-containing protein [Hymenobacter sp.]|nr:SusE domain-containing protein [Hymenobacter sp.]